MIRANISEVKNRLSYYLRQVQGGEQVEILDRNTPLARIIHISQSEVESGDPPWIKEIQQLGIVTPPKTSGFSAELLSGKKLVSCKNKPAKVLEALLDERVKGR